MPLRLWPVLLRKQVIAVCQVLKSVKQHDCVMLVSFWQEAKEQEEDIIGPITIADGHLLSIPTWSHPLMMYT